MTRKRDWRPKYVQAADDLREQIVSGQLAPNEALPSEAELAVRYGISRTSLRQALRLLREQGLIRVDRGNGTFVKAPVPRVRRDAAQRYQWEKEHALEVDDAKRLTDGATEQDTGLNFEDIEFEATFSKVAASAPLARVFEVPEGTELLHRHFSSHKKGSEVRIGYSDSYLLYDMVAQNPELLDESKEPWPGGTQHQLSTLDVELDHIIDEVNATIPTPEETSLFDLDEVAGGVAVFKVRKISVSTEGRVVEVSDIVFPADRTELVYTTPLKRWK